MYSATILSKSGSGSKPSARARAASITAGQLVTMLAMVGSGVQSIRLVACLPPSFSRAKAIVPTVVDRAGRLMAVRAPHASSLASAARISPSMVRAGEESATAVSGGTGHTARTPARGSRIMPLKKLDAAPLGLPGRTLTVISLTFLAQTKPLRP